MQVACNATMEEWGFLKPGPYLIHDRASTYGDALSPMLDDAGVKRRPLPPRSPWLKAYAERWVKSVKDETLSRVMLVGDSSLRHVLSAYVEHYHQERCHQGLGNVMPFRARQAANDREGPLECRERLGGLLKYYNRKAA